MEKRHGNSYYQNGEYRDCIRIHCGEQYFLWTFYGKISLENVLGFVEKTW